MTSKVRAKATSTSKAEASDSGSGSGSGSRAAVVTYLCDTLGVDSDDAEDVDSELEAIELGRKVIQCAVQSCS